MNTRDGHVVCEEGNKNAHSVRPKEKGEPVTALACIHASGNLTPPTVIFKGNRLHTEYKGQLPPGSYAHTSDSGYVNPETF
jgi:hypothetical protein